MSARDANSDISVCMNITRESRNHTDDRASGDDIIVRREIQMEMTIRVSACDVANLISIC